MTGSGRSPRAALAVVVGVTVLLSVALSLVHLPSAVLFAQVIGTAAPIAPSWPRVPLNAVTNGIRRPENQLVTSRSRQIQVIASPMPTKTRAASAAPYDSASANPACASVSTIAPVSSTLRGP